jgi:dTDP-4-amino-4,6-dideoxygalactose transaminase
MDSILRIARSADVAVVEDNAHGLFGSYKGKPLGSFGVLATQSFHETKNFSCGEGGALLINDAELVERAEIVREKGTDRSRFFRGEVDKYSWVDLGSSYLPSELLAAFLLAQLEQREAVQARRRAIFERYHSELAEWASALGARFTEVPSECAMTHHLFALILPDSDARAELIAHLRERGILAVFHYLPLHTSEMGLRYGGQAGDCPVSEDLSARILRLPLYGGLSDEEQGEVIRALREFEVRQAATRHA